MTETLQFETLQAYAAALLTSDLERITSFFADDITYEDVPMGVLHRSKEGAVTLIRDTLVGSPDFRVVVEPSTIFTSGTRFAWEWVMTGTHQRDFPGIPATGKTFSVRGTTIGEVEKGKLKRIVDYWDMAAFLQQLGRMPMPG